MNELKLVYDPLYKHAVELTASLNSGGFDADIDWQYSPEEGCPLPYVTVAGYGTLCLSWGKTIYRFMLSRKKALVCHFEQLAALYSLRVYGHDFPEELFCDYGDDGREAAFAIATSHEAFVTVELTVEGLVDDALYKIILANIRGAMDND